MESSSAFQVDELVLMVVWLVVFGFGMAVLMYCSEAGCCRLVPLGGAMIFLWRVVAGGGGWWRVMAGDSSHTIASVSSGVPVLSLSFYHLGIECICLLAAKSIQSVPVNSADLTTVSFLSTGRYIGVLARSAFLLACAFGAISSGHLALGDELDLRTGSAAPTIADTVEDLLNFTAEEKSGIDSVIDGEAGIDSPGLYVLLRRSCMAADEDMLLVAAATSSIESISTAPGIFRGRLIQLHLDIYRVSRHTPDDEAAANWWGRRDCWRLDCLDRNSGQALVVIMAELPQWLDLREYTQPISASVPAFFCKMARLPRSGRDGDDVYPVFVTRTLYGRKVKRSVLGRVTFFLLLVLLAVWWFVMRVKARRKKNTFATSQQCESEMPPTGDFDCPAVNEQLVEEMKRFKRGDDDTSRDGVRDSRDGTRDDLPQ